MMHGNIYFTASITAIMSSISNYVSTVNAFYLAYYGRPADPAGLDFWVQKLDQFNGDLGAIKEAFATSAEASARFASEDTAVRITQIYQQLFDRAPEAEGLRFWSEAIDAGRLSLADAAIEILRGAQSSDLDLSVLRLQAAEQFTAEVVKSQLAYDGNEAVAAARVLVEAVKLDSSQDDIAAMAKAAARFADVATHTPTVIAALGAGVQLGDLFDTARGTAEPVGLMQALADTAAAAAGNPDTLESLLRGGGMAQVLKVMPKSATLQDVVDALQSGGLPAAVDVVYPPAPDTSTPAPTPEPTPPAPLSLTYMGVTEDEHDSHSDNVTNVGKVDVDFHLVGDLAAGQRFAYSVDGQEWSTDDVAVVGHIVTVQNLDLSQGTPVGAGGSPDAHANLATTVHLRVVDANSQVIGQPVSQQIVYDHYAAALTVGLEKDSASRVPGSDSDGVTNDATLKIDGLEQGATVEYGVDLLDTTVWSEDAPTLQQGSNSFSVRQVDAAGNAGEATRVSFTLDTQVPGKPALALDDDTGNSAADGVTRVGTFTVSGLDTAAGSCWEYSTNGSNWFFGGANDSSGKANVDLATLNLNSGSLWVRQYDVAGNTSALSNVLSFTLDTTAPTNAVNFHGIVGEDQGVATTSQGKVDVRFTLGLDDDGLVEWRLKDGDGKWTPVEDAAYSSDGYLTIADIDLSKADQTIELRVVDAAGNVGMSFSQPIDGPVTPEFTVTPGPNGLQITSSVGGALKLASIGGDYSVRTTNGATDMNAGTVTVGAQLGVIGGVFEIRPDGGTAVKDATQQAYALGTDSLGEETIVGSYAWGFRGDDTVNGTSGNDVLYGGDGNDFLMGNAGDDILVGGEGSNRIVGGAGADRIDVTLGGNRLSYDGTGASVVTGGSETAGGFDVVTFSSGGALNYSDQSFQFGGAIADTFKVNAAAPEDASGDALLAALNDAFHTQSPLGTGRVMLANFDNQDQFLVYESGDGVVDNNDVVIQLVGTVPSGIFLDTSTNTVVFTFHMVG